MQYAKRDGYVLRWTAHNPVLFSSLQTNARGGHGKATNREDSVGSTPSAEKEYECFDRK